MNLGDALQYGANWTGSFDLEDKTALHKDVEVVFIIIKTPIPD